MLRKVLVLTAALFALTATAAQAHTASASVSCGSVTINWLDFASSGDGNGGFNTPQYSIEYTPHGGGTPTLFSGGVKFDGSFYTMTFALPPHDGTVVASSAWTTAQTRDRTADSASGTFTVGDCPPSSPSISTSPSPTTASVGSASLTDTATLTGGDTPTGTITWRLYGPNDPTCSAPNPPSVSAAVNSAGSATSPAITVTRAGTYQWVASYGGDPYNNAVAGTCSDATEAVVVNPVAPTLTTTATPANVVVGQPVHDVAHLGGGDNPTGTITFNLYGPNPTVCTGTPVASVTTPVNGDGDYPSPSVTMTGAGTYVWVATYSGDANNTGLSNGCAEASETVTVTPATPALTTSASPTSAAVDTPITDIATLSGGTAPLTGTLQWSLYGPNDTSCTSTPLTTSTVPVNGDGTYPSPPLTPTTAGTYNWVATFVSADTNVNASIPPVGCGDNREQVVVGPVGPQLTTSASPAAATVNTPITDVATLSGGFNPTGTLQWSLYGPNDDSCSATPMSTAKVPVSGDGQYTSPPLIPSTAGTYHWVATYSGDVNNIGVGPIGCADSSEMVVITPALALTTTASPSTVTLGAPVTDVAHLTGGIAPVTGTLQWALYPSTDASCSSSTPLTTTTVAVNGDGDYTSPPLTPTAAGSYHWVAQFTSSSAANPNVGPAGCTDPNEAVTVGPVTPTLTTTATPPTVVVGQPVHDVAHLGGGDNPTGTITFNLYGPNPSTCTGTPVTSVTTTVTGDGDYSSPSVTMTGTGTFVWVATYSGDANNAPLSNGCAESSETVTVTAPPPGPTPSFTLTKLQSDTTSPTFTTSPITANIGDTIQYEIVVTNTGNTPLNLALVDTMCTSIAGPTGSAVSNGQLAIGGTAMWTCLHVVVAGDFPTYVNVAQVTATPPGGSPLPPQRASVLANIPRANVAAVCIASKLTIKQTTTNHNGTVNAIVTGGGLKKVVFYLDGRAVKTLTKPNLSGGRYELSTKLSSTRYGTHSVTAKATNTCGKTSSDGLTFAHNAPIKKVVPKFTG